MKNVLILHGAGNDSTGNWFLWLKEELEQKGYKVWVPDLPNSGQPIQKDWLDTIFSNNQWQFDENSIMIGHSSGATLILRILEKLPISVRINKAVLVAGPVDKGTIPEYFAYKEDVTREAFNWSKIKNSCEKFYLIYSDNDPYDCGQRHGKVIQEQIGGELIIKPGEGHFNLEKSPDYKQFPLLLELID